MVYDFSVSFVYQYMFTNISAFSPCLVYRFVSDPVSVHHNFTQVSWGRAEPPSSYPIFCYLFHAFFWLVIYILPSCQLLFLIITEIPLVYHINYMLSMPTLYNKTVFLISLQLTHPSGWGQACLPSITLWLLIQTSITRLLVSREVLCSI